MSLQQFLELADCRVGLTQWSRQTVPESGSSDLEGPVTKACVSARDHTGWNIRRTKPTVTDIWDKLAVIRQVARCWTIQRLVCEHSQLKLYTSPHRQPVEPSQDWCDMVWPAGSSHQSNVSISSHQSNVSMSDTTHAWMYDGYTVS